MPTGYTAAITKDMPLETFVWLCARAFGALVTMRDDPMDAPIPQKFEPSAHYRDSLERARKRLLEVQAWTPEDALADLVRRREQEDANMAKYRAEREETRRGYVRMLSLVEAWQPPTPDHWELKKFMLEQITGSIKFDCTDYEPKRENAITALDWKQQQIDAAERDVIYSEESWRKEQERVRGRNEWIDALRHSFTTPEVSA